MIDTGFPWVNVLSETVWLKSSEYFIWHFLEQRETYPQLVCDTNQNQIPYSNVPNSLGVKGATVAYTEK